MTRRGAALLAALIAILVAGSLAALVLSAARLRWLGGGRQILRAQAQAYAWTIAARRAASWDPTLDTLAPGAGRGWPSPWPGVTDSVVRLGPALYQARAAAVRTGADGSVLARSTARALIELVSLRVPDHAAVATTGPMMLSAAGIADGSDRIPPGWDALCPPPGPAGPGVLTDTAGPAGLAPVSVSDAVAWADVRVAGVVGGVGPALDSAGQCDRANPANWGGPAGGPCLSHFAIVTAQPGSRLESGTGQGLLIALGGLELTNDFRYAGAIVSLGPLLVSGRATVLGAVFAADTVFIGDSARVERSTCAVRRALTGTARPFRTPERRWSSDE